MKKEECLLIVSDMDGTFLADGYKGRHFLTDEQHSFFHSLKARGVHFSFASGRSPYSMLNKIVDFEMDDLIDFIICHNGAAIYDTKARSFLRRSVLAKEKIHAVHDFVQGVNLSVAIGMHEWERLFVLHDNMGADLEAQMNELHKTNVDTIAQMPLDTCVKMILFTENPKQNRQLFTLLCDAGLNKQFAIKPSLGLLIEITDKGVTKSDAVHWVTQQRNIPLSSVMAFGNADNDLEMIRDVGWGVAMCNADEHIRAAADDITRLDNDNHGVFDYIYRFFSSDQNA